jgi:hypothetical protein
VKHRRDEIPNQIEDMFQPGIFHLSLQPGKVTTLVFSTESDAIYRFGSPWHEEEVANAWNMRQQYSHSLQSKALEALEATHASTMNFSLTKPLTLDSWTARLAETAQTDDETPTIFHPKVKTSKSRKASVTTSKKAALPNTAHYSQGRNASVLSDMNTYLISALQQLVQAADQCVIDTSYCPISTRPLFLMEEQISIIPGYPLDDHIFPAYAALRATPGLFLENNRLKEARSVLRGSLDQLNRWHEGEATESFSWFVETLLWTCRIVAQYLAQKRDWIFLKEAVPVLHACMQSLMSNEIHLISVDAESGLLRIPAEDRLMTAYLHDTMHTGTAVFADINTLWYCALTYMSAWYDTSRSEPAYSYTAYRQRLRSNFSPRFWSESGYIRDAIDIEGYASGAGDILQASSIYAISLTGSLLQKQQADEMMQQISKQLLSPYGLRVCSDNENRESILCLPWMIGSYMDGCIQSGTFHNEFVQSTTSILQILSQDYLGTLPECIVLHPQDVWSVPGYASSILSIAELSRVVTYIYRQYRD